MLEWMIWSGFIDLALLLLDFLVVLIISSIL